MGLTPRDLLASGFADALAPADASALREWLTDQLNQLRAEPADQRLGRRRAKWSTALPGTPASGDDEPPDIA